MFPWTLIFWAASPTKSRDTEFPILLAPLAGCPKVSRAAKRVHCPTVPIVPPPWIDPRPPALLTSSSARNCPIGQFGAGLKSHGLWINRGTQGQGRKEFVGPFHLNPRKWAVFKAKVDGLDVGLFDHSMWLCKKPVVFTIVYECGAKWPSGREKHKCGAHILSFLRFKVYWPLKKSLQSEMKWLVIWIILCWIWHTLDHLNEFLMCCSLFKTGLNEWWQYKSSLFDKDLRVHKSYLSCALVFKS